MGRLEHQPSIQHLSHPHLLHLTNPQTLTLATPCSGCELQSSGWMYTCTPCNFTLHVACTQMPQLINHPSHPYHPLNLLPTPPYPGGLFNCDGCGCHGRGFSYHCNQCDFDVHILCASKPLSLMHHLHAHKLELTFDPPYQTKGFSCDICRKLGSNHWLYRCNFCEFDAHLDCASNSISAPQVQAQTQPPIQMQHYNSFPGGSQIQNGNNLAHSQSLGTLQNSQVGMSSRMNNNVNGTYPPLKNNFVHSQSTGRLQNSQVGRPAAPPPNNNNVLVNAMVQGFVQGAADQVGQNLMQNVMNDGGGGDGGGGNGGDPGFGSSMLSGIFSDSSDTQS
ncbi:hypothetical protein EZV62_023480 [Acer yangbiense]|uniref:DC1 domain-containing protein n=1 Tax=Acer yangbiense TaxID=1000413 RepID=A0A5C7H3W9_9ROSI|nr:hypothetical protein EZV62_023480 [Acer yangbiense]